MEYKEKLDDFINTLNVILSDEMLYPKQNLGRFALEYNERIDNETDKLNCFLGLYFKENGLNHCIYIRRFNTYKSELNHALRIVYLEIMRAAFLSIDCVGELKDASDNKISVLSFQTLMSTGLEKLNK